MLRYFVHRVGNILRWGKKIYYQALGIRIGRRTMISLGAKLDIRRGTITIGEDCLITYGCLILSHDSAARMLDHEDDGAGFVQIGDNVFLGAYSVVLRNVRIGSNTVVGAGSIVTKDIPDGVVACGNPARVVKRLPLPYPRLSSKDHLA